MTHARHTLKAGAAYFAIVFAVGFALGTVRTLFLAPRLGEQIADYFRNLATPHGLIGLTGQIVFALIPLLRARIPDVSKSSRGP